jgi:guanylate kinase
MGKIVCIIGKSAVGKDRIYKELKEIFKDKLKTIIPYTTRPQRENEIDGFTYNFIDNEKMCELERDEKIIEKRLYKTIEGLWTYATIDDGTIDLENNSYIYIATIESLYSMRRKFGYNNIIPIYIECDDCVRIQRAIDREHSSHAYSEMCRRWLQDEQDFSDEIIKDANVNIFYNNIDNDINALIVGIFRLITSQI